MHTHRYIHPHPHTYECTHTHTPHTHTHTHTYTYSTHIHPPIPTHIYTHTHTYIQIYTHTVWNWVQNFRPISRHSLNEAPVTWGQLSEKETRVQALVSKGTSKPGTISHQMVKRDLRGPGGCTRVVTIHPFSLESEKIMWGCAGRSRKWGVFRKSVGCRGISKSLGVFQISHLLANSKSLPIRYLT